MTGERGTGLARPNGFVPLDLDVSGRASFLIGRYDSVLKLLPAPVRR